MLEDWALGVLFPMSLTATARKVYRNHGDSWICLRPFTAGSSTSVSVCHVSDENCVENWMTIFLIGLPFDFPSSHEIFTDSPASGSWTMNILIGGSGGPVNDYISIRSRLTVFPQMIAETISALFRTNRGDYSREGDYLKYCSLVVVP